MDEDFRRIFYNPEDRETFNAKTETGLIENREAIDDFTNQQKKCKHKREDSYSNMNNLFRCIEANNMKKKQIESFLASEVDHLLSKKQCHIINNSLTSLARAVLGNIGLQSWQYGPSAASSALPRPRTIIPHFGPRARLVSG